MAGIVFLVLHVFLVGSLATFVVVGYMASQGAGEKQERSVVSVQAKSLKSKTETQFD